MNSKTGVLVGIKVCQLVGSIVCMSMHIYAYSTGLKAQHLTIFCGTYMGFTLVNVAFLSSAIMGKPAAEELDMAFGVIGSCLFYICGVLGMFFIRAEQLEEQERTHSLLVPNAYEVDPRFFVVTRAQAAVSLMTALSFVFDACLKFDMWKYDWDMKMHRMKPDAFDPPALRLFCFEPCDKWYQKWKRDREERAAEMSIAVPRLLSPEMEGAPQRMRDGFSGGSRVASGQSHPLLLMVDVPFIQIFSSCPENLETVIEIDSVPLTEDPLQKARQSRHNSRTQRDFERTPSPEKRASPESFPSLPPSTPLPLPSPPPIPFPTPGLEPKPAVRKPGYPHTPSPMPQPTPVPLARSLPPQSLPTPNEPVPQDTRRGVKMTLTSSDEGSTSSSSSESSPESDEEDVNYRQQWRWPRE